MKKTLQCPKCEGRQIAHVTRMTLPIAAQSIRRPLYTLALVMRRSFMTGTASVGGFETFVCRTCGFTEWYAIDADQLDPAVDKDVRFLDNEPKATLR